MIFPNFYAAHFYTTLLVHLLSCKKQITNFVSKVYEATSIPIDSLNIQLLTIRVSGWSLVVHTLWGCTIWLSSQRKKRGVALALFLGPKVKSCGNLFNKTQQLPKLVNHWLYFAHFWSNSNKSGLLKIDCFYVRLEDIRRPNVFWPAPLRFLGNRSEWQPSSEVNFLKLLLVINDSDIIYLFFIHVRNVGVWTKTITEYKGERVEAVKGGFCKYKDSWSDFRDIPSTTAWVWSFGHSLWLWGSTGIFFTVFIRL